MISGVHHAQISIPAGRENEAREFYCQLLGLREIEKPENLKAKGGFWLQLANLQVHVGIENGIDRSKLNSHVAYAVEDLEQVRELLAEKGIEPLECLPIPGFARFECRDPFGNRIEFIQKLVPQRN